jgi:hypothetical protein
MARFEYMSFLEHSSFSAENDLDFLYDIQASRRDGRGDTLIKHLLFVRWVRRHGRSAFHGLIHVGIRSCMDLLAYASSRLNRLQPVS